MVKALPNIYICEKKRRENERKAPYLCSWFLKDSDLACMIVEAHLCVWMIQYLGTFQIYCLQDNQNSE
jgi:hypothetical protein